jgi:hypothetical protein
VPREIRALGKRAHRRPLRAEREAKPARRPLPEPVWLLPPVEAPLLRYATFDSPAAGQKVSYLVYLPRGYEKSPD